MEHGKNQHVLRRGNEWIVKGEGNTRATHVTRTQREAIELGREIAQNQQSELFIHNKSNQFRERNSYGNDPFPPKG